MVTWLVTPIDLRGCVGYTWGREGVGEDWRDWGSGIGQHGGFEDVINILPFWR